MPHCKKADNIDINAQIIYIRNANIYELFIDFFVLWLITWSPILIRSALGNL